MRVGMGGWTYPPWRDNFYPRGLPQRLELEHASRQVNLIEINATFYRAQSPATYARWRQQTPPGFVFSAKAPMRITAARALADTGSRVEDFVGGLAELGDRLGPVLWQFGERRALSAGELQDFLALLPAQAGGRRLRHAIELRHPATANAGTLALLGAAGHAAVFTDAAAYPSFADLTADFVYARLMRSQANRRRGYTAAQLAKWAARARTWAAGGDPGDLPHLRPACAPPCTPRDVHVVFIGAAKERNPHAAMALLELLRQ
jgi:uncharacterized protein YecE (DUF72 family)